MTTQTLKNLTLAGVSQRALARHLGVRVCSVNQALHGIISSRKIWDAADKAAKQSAGTAERDARAEYAERTKHRNTGSPENTKSIKNPPVQTNIPITPHPQQKEETMSPQKKITPDLTDAVEMIIRAVGGKGPFVTHAVNNIIILSQHWLDGRSDFYFDALKCAYEIRRLQSHPLTHPAIKNSTDAHATEPSTTPLKTYPKILADKKEGLLASGPYGADHKPLKL